MTFIDKIKQKIWRFIYGFFSPLQKALLRMGIIRHGEDRSKYHIGWLAPGKTLDDLKLHLHGQWGFGNHFVAWQDKGQVLGWRKLIDFRDQYHLRVFKDGEIRGHYEYTPEAYPFAHFLEKGEKNAKEDFLKFLGDFVVQERHISKLEVDPNAYDPDSEITIDAKK